MAALRVANGNPTELGTETYSGTARCFHWLTVILVLFLVPIGLVMTSLDPGPLQDALFVTHESLGLTLFALLVLRLLWRLSHAPPPPSRDLSPLEIRASQAVHWLLYLALFAMPISGYILVVTGGYPLSYFGLVRVPRLFPTDHAVSDLALGIHVALQYVVYALVLMHAGAALHHHYARRNDVLARMLPILRRRA